MICCPQYFMGMNGRIYFMRYYMPLIYIPHIVSVPRKDAPFGTSPISARKISIENIPSKRDVPLARLYACVVYIPPIISTPIIFRPTISPQLYSPNYIPPIISRPTIPSENIPSKRDVPLARLYVSAIYIPHICMR